MEHGDDSRVYWALLAASCAHVVEEYAWPGGFLAAAREMAPGVFGNASIPIVVGVNASMILGCLYGALVRRRNPTFGLSMASLLLVNSAFHAAASLRMRKYVPGLATGLVLYVPLSLRAFSAYRASPRYRRSSAWRAAVQGAALHTVPFVAFAVRGALARKAGNSEEEGCR